MEVIQRILAKIVGHEVSVEEMAEVSGGRMQGGNVVTTPTTT